MGRVLTPSQRAARYAESVLSGEQIACDFIVRACERFERDLIASKKSTKYPFVYDEAAADRAVQFVEKMPHIKGEWSKKGLLLKLEDWQCFAVCNVFGWKCRRDVLDEYGNVMMMAGTRKYRTIYWEVARKNAKSTLVAAIALYLLVADGEAGAEIYSAATTHKQAKIVWEDAKRMAQKCSGFAAHFGVGINAKALNVLNTASRFEALHAQGETLDGLNVHCAINDELHAHKKRDLYDVLETATGSRTQPLIINITTAGTNRAGICYELRAYGAKVLQRVVDDETFFCLIYTLDKDDDPMDRSVWPKANPNYNVSVYPFDMERIANKAEESPASMNNFLTKRLNVWCSADSAWMNMRKWDRCADHTLRESDFYSDPLWIGVDLASKVDMNAVVRLYKRIINGDTHVYCFPSFYLPQTAIEEGANSQYDGWRRRGLLIETPGDIIDMDRIEEDVIAMRDGRDLQELCFDPGHNATQWASHIDDAGIETVEVRPTVMNFSEAMKWWEALVKAGRFHHDGNEIMTWMVSNVVVKYDHKDNIYPRKERPENKIDGPVAVITAMNRLLADEAEGDDIEVFSV